MARRLLVALAMMVPVLGNWSSPANAHTALLDASPAADQVVGGTVDGVDMTFLDPITDAVVTVSYNGAPVPGSTVVSSGEFIRFKFDEPLQVDGRYQVFYEMTSFDLDYTTSGFFFTYSADAAPAVPLEDPTAGGDSSFPIVPTLIGSTVLIAVLGLFVWQFDARRRAAAPANGDWYDDDGYQDAHQAPGYRDFSYGDDGSDDDDW